MGSSETKEEPKDWFVCDIIYPIRTYKRKILALSNLIIELKEGIDTLNIHRDECKVLVWKEHLTEVINIDNKRLKEAEQKLVEYRKFNRDEKIYNRYESEIKDAYRKPVYVDMNTKKRLDKRANKIKDKPHSRRNSTARYR